MIPVHTRIEDLCRLAILILASGFPALASAQSTATYSVEFEATWSAQSHPSGFPSNPHFSRLIGGTHTAAIAFWSPGELATAGIESMAERGSTTILRNEVQAAVDNGTAMHVLAGDGIGRSPGSVSIQFEISSEFPLVTLVSMLAPSPDWFVGVHGLSLLQDGQWVPSLEVPLNVYDAGTDSGPNYTSSNDDTNPAGLISLLTTVPFEQSGLVGRFIFTQRQTTAQSPDVPDLPTLSQPYPNPARSAFRIDLKGGAPGRTVARIFDVTGRLAAEKDFAELGQSERQLQMSLAGIAPGLYFVEIRAAGIVHRTSLTIIR